MEGILKNEKGVGVIICRMQVPRLTDSHKKLINTVASRHKRVIICLGTTNRPIDVKNPFPFEFRKQMIVNSFAELGSRINIIPLPDQSDDNSLWVKTLDSLIQSFLAYGETPILYGGRDSFIPYYEKEQHCFECVALQPEDYDSGTDLRNLTSMDQPEYSAEAASAILWAIRQILNK